MQTKTDTSYGVIPYTLIEGKPHFLLIYQTSHLRGDHYWVFPKGHLEEHESPEEAARRELKEETGLSIAQLHDTPLSVNYEFTNDDVLIQKTVTFFLGQVTDTTLQLDNHEVTEAVWLPYEAAREKLSHESTREILDQANTALN